MTSRTRASLGFWALTLSAAAAATTCNKTETTFHPPETTTGTSSGGGGTGGQVQPGCTNGFLDKGEADVDCGGATCPKCADGRACKFPADCANGVCTANVCQAPTCDDTVRNGDETDVDCGGTCPVRCADDKVCISDADCTSSWCKPTTHKCKTPTCTDGLKNGEETDLDCGGKCPTKCGDGKGCLIDADCANDFCDTSAQPPVCVASSCLNGVKDDTETDLDCGGPKCAPCAEGKACEVSSDCTTAVCSGKVCQPPACNDMVQNGTETDVDCGGSCTIKCADGRNCLTNADCTNGYCSTTLVCKAPSCTDGFKNGTESDVDCGGSCTTKCGNGQPCNADTDCTSTFCNTAVQPAVCVDTLCTDSIKDDTETDVDCGGGKCPKCAEGKACKAASDCASSVCSTLVCQPPTCDDTVQNGTETDVDCGGSCTLKCADSKKCLVNTDCVNGYCPTTHLCKTPTCTDGIKNGAETDVDCGGTCPSKCGNGQPCKADSDCASDYCNVSAPIPACAASSCPDGVKNDTETDVDCGGGKCPKCAVAKSCKVASDCASGVCAGSVCQPPACDDTVQNGTETDVDCGGSCTLKCPDGKKCTTDADCLHGYCPTTGLCKTPSCTDGVENGTETDVDCGGSCTTKCADGKLCLVDGDCQSLYCSLSSNPPVCAVPSCGNAIKDGTETDVDCGGPTCPDCDVGKACLVGSDCTSGVCTSNKCAAPSCVDGVKNGDETDVDCGGPTCPNKCADTQLCLANTDCTGGYCNAKVSPAICKSPACNDGVKNGTETDVDCGGTCPNKCADGKGCATGTDCTSLVCGPMGLCLVPTCSDGVKNGNEGDVDCGGSYCPRCPTTKKCNVASDCVSGTCTGGLCVCPPGMITIPKPGSLAFCIDATEVTYAQYASFYTANPDINGQRAQCLWNTNYSPTGEWPAQPGRQNEPVRWVNWCQADAYCQYNKKHLCGGITGGKSAQGSFADASVSQWFSACSSQGAKPYPYGNTFQSTYCVSQAASLDGGPIVIDLCSGHTSCVGGAPALYDMSGNVAEWEDSCTADADRSDLCLARGGSVDSTTSTSLRCDSGGSTASISFRRDYAAHDIGFRCCLE